MCFWVGLCVTSCIVTFGLCVSVTVASPLGYVLGVEWARPRVDGALGLRWEKPHMERKLSLRGGNCLAFPSRPQGGPWCPVYTGSPDGLAPPRLPPEVLMSQRGKDGPGPHCSGHRLVSQLGVASLTLANPIPFLARLSALYRPILPLSFVCFFLPCFNARAWGL